MGELESIAKAKKELEEMYLGVPDDSVNLTFQDLVKLTVKKRQSPNLNIKSLGSDTMLKIDQPISTLTKLPSLDFNGALEVSSPYSIHNHNHASPCHDSTAVSMSATATPPHQGRRRPGIPHSNICALCTTYVYIFRHRCLVCGRVYCRQCVGDGMGDMSEGRKCVECLGIRFSQRYIQIAGQIGCFMWYPSTVKQQELKWAEKGPRRSGDSGPGRSGVVSRSRSRSPAQISPSRARSPSPTPSFVMDSPYSPYTDTLPLDTIHCLSEI